MGFWQDLQPTLPVRQSEEISTGMAVTSIMLGSESAFRMPIRSLIFNIKERVVKHTLYQTIRTELSGSQGYWDLLVKNVNPGRIDQQGSAKKACHRRLSRLARCHWYISVMQTPWGGRLDQQQMGWYKTPQQNKQTKRGDGTQSNKKQIQCSEFHQLSTRIIIGWYQATITTRKRKQT